MKKVRLFAVAAAMGMFAATVNAAAPKVTKEAYTATWGTSETVVKVEFGGKVILPTADVSVMKQTMSTDKKYAPNVKGGYGVGELKSTECYVGFSSEIGKDTNNDGIVDTPLLIWGKDGSNYASVSRDWFYNDAKYFPTAKTSLYYFGMTSNGYGARFLAPNQDARDGVIVINELKDGDDVRVNYHGWYDNTDAGNQALVDMYVKAGKIKAITDPKYGDVIGYKTTDLNLDEANVAAKNKVTTEYVELKLTTDAQRGKYALADLNEQFANWVSGRDMKDIVTLTSKTDTKAAKYTASEVTAQPEIEYYATFSNLTTRTKLAKNTMYEVKETRDGFEVVGPIASATVSDANGREIKPISDSILFLINNGSRYGHEVYARVKVASTVEDTYKHEFVWSVKDGGFNKKELATSVTHTASNPHTIGKKFFGAAYRVNTPKNTTDKYVVDFGMGEYTDMDLGGRVNSSKATMTFDYNNKKDTTKELVTPAVKLGYTWYPAFNTEADLIDFVTKMSGLREADETWFETNEPKLEGGKRTWANGVVENDYIPSNELDHYKAKQCAYATGEATAVEASAYNVTADTSTVDVNKGGVYTVKQVVKVGDAEVASRNITVVVAPKYVREYKNGKVVSLKAYHLNNNLYSHTTFDYAKKTSTAVFYAQDGVTAVETVTSAIK